MFKDSFLPGRDHRPKQFRIRRSEEFFASLPYAPKNTLASIQVAEQVVDGMVGNLKASGVFPFGIATALGMAMLKIANEENWSNEMRQSMLSPAILEFDRTKNGPGPSGSD